MECTISKEMLRCQGIKEGKNAKR
uniref:Uncharacterized protein n=1 Tax=Arundo donax TaxID=35708 RepID=A0A0A8XW41_ARUDO